MSAEERTIGSIGGRVTRALQWNLAISFATIAIQAGFAAILARLLTPRDFGVYAIGYVATQIASLLGERGLVGAIIREPVLDRSVMGSVVILSWLISGGLALITFVLAPLAGLSSSESDKIITERVVQVMSLSIFITGLNAPAKALLLRELRFREAGLIDSSGIVLGAGLVASSLAFVGFGTWSLVLGALVNATIVSTSYWWKARGQWSICWHISRMRRIGLAGTTMSLLRILDGLWFQLPVVIIHSFLSSAHVGLYQRAQTLVDVATWSTVGRVSTVLFPVLASQQDRNAFLRQIIPPLIGLYSLFLFSVSTFFSIAGHEIVVFVLGPKWQGSAYPLALIMIAYASLLMSMPAGVQLEAKGAFGSRIASASLGVVSLLIIGWILTPKYGLIGISMAVIISGLIAGIATIAAVVRKLEIPAMDIIRWVTPTICIVVSMAAIVGAFKHYCLGEIGSPGARLVAMAAVSLSAFIIAFRIFVSGNKRTFLSNHFVAGSSGPIIKIAGILGLRAHHS